jgi:hypothetical protein
LTSALLAAPRFAAVDQDYLFEARHMQALSFAGLTVPNTIPPGI